MTKNINKEFENAFKGFKPATLFSFTVADIMAKEDGEGTPLPKAAEEYIAKVGAIRYVCSTYPFAMSEELGSFETITCDPFYYTPKTYEDLVRPMCVWLTDIEQRRNYATANHTTDGVYIEDINIGISKDGKEIGCMMHLGS